MRDIPESANIKTCTIERDLDRRYACFTVEIEVEELNYNEEITNPIGIDHLIALSNGETENNPKYLSKSEWNRIIKVKDDARELKHIER